MSPVSSSDDRGDPAGLDADQPSDLWFAKLAVDRQVKHRLRLLSGEPHTIIEFAALDFWSTLCPTSHYSIARVIRVRADDEVGWSDAEFGVTRMSDNGFTGGKT